MTFLFLAVSVTECKKNSVISDRQAILFELEYVNYSQTYQHSGFIIDNEGDILTYNNPQSWNFPDRELRISAGQVAENLAMCTNSGLKITKEELLKYSNHIRNIAATKVSSPKSVAEDAGSTEYFCYQYFESSGMYKGTIIRMEGDVTCENLNFFSKKVADWMKNINTSLQGR